MDALGAQPRARRLLAPAQPRAAGARPTFPPTPTCATASSTSSGVPTQEAMRRAPAGKRAVTSLMMVPRSSGDSPVPRAATTTPARPGCLAAACGGSAGQRLDAWLLAMQCGSLPTSWCDHATQRAVPGKGCCMLARAVRSTCPAGWAPAPCPTSAHRMRSFTYCPPCTAASTPAPASAGVAAAAARQAGSQAAVRSADLAQRSERESLGMSSDSATHRSGCSAATACTYCWGVTVAAPVWMDTAGRGRKGASGWSAWGGSKQRRKNLQGKDERLPGSGAGACQAPWLGAVMPRHRSRPGILPPRSAHLMPPHWWPVAWPQHTRTQRGREPWPPAHAAAHPAQGSDGRRRAPAPAPLAWAGSGCTGCSHACGQIVHQIVHQPGKQQRIRQGWHPAAPSRAMAVQAGGAHNCSASICTACASGSFSSRSGVRCSTPPRWVYTSKAGVGRVPLLVTSSPFRAPSLVEATLNIGKDHGNAPGAPRSTHACSRQLPCKRCSHAITPTSACNCTPSVTLVQGHAILEGP